MSDLDSINEEQRLYVLKCGDGYTHLGFDVCESRSLRYLAWLESMGRGFTSDIGATIRKKGTKEAYEAYEMICRVAREWSGKTGMRCPAELTEQLIGLEHKRVEVVDKYGETRRFIVGKSTGWAPVHLEIETSKSSGGSAVMGAPFQSVRVIK